MRHFCPLAWWPIDEQGLAQDVVLRQESPGMGVAGVISVVAKGKELSIRHDPTAAVGGGGLDIRLVDGCPVDNNPSVLHFDCVARQADDTLDEIQLAAWMPKDDDVASLRLVELIGEVADDQIFAVEQRGVHAVAVDAIAADQAVDDPENKERQQERFDNLADKSGFGTTLGD